MGQKSIIAGKGLLMIIVFLIVALNIYNSQQHSNLMIPVLTVQQKSALELLVKINKTEYYPTQYYYFLSLFGKDFKQDLNREKNRRNLLIKKYLLALEKNPKSRDVLIELAVLHYKNEDYQAANNYYHQVKIIDPWVNIEELEKL